MRQEIGEQPQVLARLVGAEYPAVEALAGLLRRRPPRAVFFAARGTSDNAALYGHYLFETILRIPAGLASPSVVTIYHRTPKLRGTLVIGLSQSGRSADVVRYVETARRAGAQTVAITNDPRSPLARAAHAALTLHAGVERSVAATKTYTAQLTLLSLLVTAFAGNRRLLDRHRALPDLMAQALEGEAHVEALANRLHRVDRCIVTARGYDFATAREAALKFKETAYLAAEALSSADFLHGPIALVEPRFPVLLIAPPGPARPHLTRVAKALGSRRARLIALSPGGFDALAPARIHVPAGIDERLTPHVYIVPLQLLAYHLALARGFDPDRPRGLSKVTRVL